MTAQTPRKTSPLPAIIAIFVFFILGAVFLSEFGDVSGGGEAEPTLVKTAVASSYMSDVSAILVGADPVLGEALTKRYSCTSCHAGAGADNLLAPKWAGIGTKAATRRPPLTAAAYLYESIIHPTAFEVEGYSGNMPVIYSRTIPAEDIGHIIAYLLTLTDE